MLAIRNIRKKYIKDDRELPLFDNASLTVKTGEFVALRGPSGCGKSTLLLMAGALLDVDQGSILINDIDPVSLSPDARADFRRKTIGFVFQEFHLIPYLTVEQNVLSAAMRGLTDDYHVRTLLEKFGLINRISHFPSQLSTGERQRTALARALINRPKLLLADEPTGNLDTENAEQVLSSLRDFSNLGGAVLLVTHDDRAASKTDRICHIKELQIS